MTTAPVPTSRLVLFKGGPYRPPLGRESGRALARAACQCLGVSEVETAALCAASVTFVMVGRKHRYPEHWCSPGASAAIAPTVLEACTLTVHKTKRVGLKVVSARCSLLAFEGEQ